MDLNCFFEALEELANRLFDHENPFDNLNKLIQLIKVQVHPQASPRNDQSSQIKSGSTGNSTAGSGTTGLTSNKYSPKSST